MGLSKEIICVGPKFIKNRIMSNEGQTLYDLSLATINFLKTHRYISDSLKIRAKKKIIGRCLKWNRRKHKKNNLISNIFRRLFSKVCTDKCYSFCRFCNHTHDNDLEGL